MENATEQGRVEKQKAHADGHAGAMLGKLPLPLCEYNKVAESGLHNKTNGCAYQLGATIESMPYTESQAVEINKLMQGGGIRRMLPLKRRKAAVSCGVHAR
jgi:hypothetical protein